ncbi:MAG: maleylpyruvate isomerase N-terminal domain-containing protein, partial [Mycobacterium sp.]
MDRDQIFAATAQERRRIADLIDDLDEAQLATPSLCAGWDVKT